MTRIIVLDEKLLRKLVRDPRLLECRGFSALAKLVEEQKTK